MFCFCRSPQLPSITSAPVDRLSSRRIVQVIEPLCNDLYDRHASDPLTKPWFGAHCDAHARTADQVKKHVYTFFLAGIGGPHKYEGRSMVDTHASMKITNNALHALTNHVMEQMCARFHPLTAYTLSHAAHGLCE